MSSPVQIPLLQPEALDPLPVDSGYYVSVLQNKIGELSALRHASGATWERMVPLLEFVGRREPPDPLTATSVAGWVKRANDGLGSHPFYLDILRMNPTASVATRDGLKPVLGELYANARKRKMRFVPVLPIGEAAESYVQLVADAALSDGNGVGLRYRILKVLPPTGMSQRDVLETELTKIGYEPGHCDLLLDLEYIDEDRELDPDDVASQLQEMSRVGKWRSVAMFGTSIPKMMSEIKEGTVGSLPRREWDLWSRLAACGLSRVPAYGDYAIQHPHPPQDAGGGGQMRANIRYTTGQETLVARGNGPVAQEGNEQYRMLCQQLVSRREFAGRAFCWGDETIEDCADERIEPGAQNVWRGAGTSHHMQLVTDELRQRSTTA